MRIEQYPLPEDPGDPTWRAVAQLMRADIRENFGPHGPEHDAAELLTQATTSVGRVRRWLAMEGEEVLGFARCVTDHPDNPDGADVHVHVGATHRGRGCGRALAEVVLESVRGVAHVTARLFTSIPEAGDALPCPGGGAVDRNSHNVRLARSLGLDLGNVYWLGHHDLAAPVEDLEQLAAAASRSLAAGWTCHTIEGVPPEAWLEPIAAAKNRTLQDAPQGTIRYSGRGWDPARVASYHERLSRQHRVLLTLVLDEDGHAVALTELSSPIERPAAMGQQLFTVVMPEHRGHGLGALVKARNLLALKQAVPQTPGVVTMNAAANRHMLAVNEALGMRTTRAVGLFRRDGQPPRPAGIT